jgi:ribosomal protein S18 acetylase RimI-like enzyme
MSGAAVRRLTAADLPAFRTLRLTALRDHPEAFASSYEEESVLDLAGFARFIPATPPAAAFGGFVADRLVGSAGLFVQDRPKLRHKGRVVGVYVQPAHRGSGLGRALLDAVIQAARDAGLVLLELSVTRGNDPAQRLYESLGFRAYGLERRALRVRDAWYDDVLMALDLD